MAKRFSGAVWLHRGHPHRAALGHLEREVMEIIWRGGRLSVREVQAQLARPIAYTTVMTTLDRLFKKGFACRCREGRAFVYSAAQTREETAATLTGGLLREMLSGWPEGAAPFLSNLVDAVSDGSDELLDELERLVRDKRQRIRKEPR